MAGLLDGLGSLPPEQPGDDVLATPPSSGALPPPISLTGPLVPAPPPPKVEMRNFTDPKAIRSAIYNKVQQAMSNIQPVENNRYALHLGDIGWADPEERSIAQHKKALLANESLHRRIRGRFTLLDKQTGQPVDSKMVTLANVPHYTNNGTFAMNGTDYVLGNQFRLSPGIYTHEKENGMLESHINVMPGKGFSHRYMLDPETGAFKVNIGQANLPLFPILKAVGLTDKEIEKAWGSDLYNINKQHDDPKVVDKLYQRLAPSNADPKKSAEEKMKFVADKLTSMEVDPEVNKRTLGKPYAKLSKDAMLDTSVKLLKISRGEAESDDRDDMAYQRVMGPEDLIAEPIAKSGAILRNMLWKASKTGSLKSVLPGMLTPSVQAAIYDYGLANPSEEINSLDMFDAQLKVSRMGTGAIGSIDSIPDSARAVHPSQLGFVDLTRTSESLKIGVDLRLAHKAKKGSDGKIYAPFINAETGEEEYKSAHDLADSVLAFPAQAYSNRKLIPALVKGKTKLVSRDKVDYILPHMENSFSPLSNLIPMKAMTQGQRVSMGSRFLIQSLALKDPEAPLVQGRMPGTDQSFENEYGKRAGAVYGREVGGRVTKVTPDGIEVRYDDGHTENHELFNNFVYNRKSLISNTPLVQEGDRVNPNQLLAKSNYTDDKGNVALGKNLKVAYLAFRGKDGQADYEDNAVISESAAKKLTSEHAYQHNQEWDDNYKKGKKNFISIFPSTYDRETLKNMDDDGVIMPGTVVKAGSPLILAAKARELSHKQMHTAHKGSFSDATVTWDHHNDGIITDVYKSDKGVNVVVKSYSPMQEADKLSGRFGDKGVVRIVPDEQMPHDENGDPFEILVNPLGVISRGNPSQVAEAVLGKIAKKTGKPYAVEDFDANVEDYSDWAKREAEKHGVSDTETVIDPNTGKRIPDVLTGYRFYTKLHHMSEAKGSARGLGSVTSEGLPARGSGDEQQAKKVAMMDVAALLSHGALEVMRDNKLIRGNQNLEYWSTFMAGNTPATPKVPMIYDKFINSLKASGINVVREGSQSHIMALTNKAINELAGDRELKNAETVSWKDGMKPIAGGLFDVGLTGGHSGNRWSKITFHEPMPNPVMEDAIRRTLNLTQEKFESVLAGKEKIGELSGPKAITNALSSINLDKAIEQCRTEIASGRKTIRDTAVRRLGFLKGCQKVGIHPKDWIVNSAPVLPPMFRPVSIMQGSGGQLVADANLLYKDLFDANQTLKEISGMVHDTSDERLNLYNSFKAVVGLGDPVNPKNVEKRVQGLLGQVFGNSPKYSIVQSKLLGTPVNTVGRGVIVPNANLSMDEVGIPENQAWTVYSPFIVRKLVRQGVGRTEALDMVQKKHTKAREMMMQEMNSSPIVLTRAPVLHRYGHMAFWPKIIKGDAVHISPIVTGGFAADFDGDTLNWHLPVSQSAREEAVAKMLPSRNLLGTGDFKSPMYKPTQEFQAGLYMLTRQNKDAPKKSPRVFASTADMRRAWSRGELDPHDEVHIVNS